MAAPGALHVLLVNLLVAGRISSKPYFDLGTSYEDMMRSVGRLCSYFGKSAKKNIWVFGKLEERGPEKMFWAL